MEGLSVLQNVWSTATSNWLLIAIAALAGLVVGWYSCRQTTANSDAGS